MSGRRAVFWVVCVALVLWSLPSAAAHLTNPGEQVPSTPGVGTTSRGFGLNADPCRWTDDGSEHEFPNNAECGGAPLNDDKHDGVSGVYVSEPDTFSVGVGACADDPVDALQGTRDVGCDVSQLFPRNVPELFFWDLDGDDCYNTLNPRPAQQELKGTNGCSSDKKAGGLEAVSFDPTVFPAGFVSSGATFCDREVFAGSGTDEKVIDDAPNAAGGVPDGTWDDGGIGGACHLGAGFYSNSGWNSPGCAGEGPTKSDNVVAHAEDWVSGDSVWIAAGCNYVGQTGGTARLLSLAVDVVNNHLGPNLTDPIGGAAGDSWEVSNFLTGADAQGAKCFYGDTLFSGTSTTTVLGGAFLTPDPNTGFGPAPGGAIPFDDDLPLVNCALATLTGGETGVSCSQDSTVEVVNYGHGGGHDDYTKVGTPGGTWTKGEVHLNHAQDTESHPAKNPGGSTAPPPAGGATVFEEVDAGVAYPDDPTACQSQFDTAPTALVFVYGTTAFTGGLWSEAGDGDGDPPVNLHPTGVIPASGGWIDSTPNFGNATDDHVHCDEDGHYEGGVHPQSSGGANQDDHENSGCPKEGDEPHVDHSGGTNSK